LDKTIAVLLVSSNSGQQGASERVQPPKGARFMDSLKAIVTHPRTERIIIGLIIVNAITLGLETSKTVMAEIGGLLWWLDHILLGIFVIELVARIAVHRLAFFKDPWSLFDFFVVAIALIPATGSLSVLRALRILRVLRLLTVVPSLRRVVAGLIGAMPGMGSIAMLLAIVYYVFAVMGAKLYAETNPELFGDLGSSAYTLFQSMTFDDWSNGIVKPLMEKGNTYSWFFVMTFMVLSAFMVLNLFIGVVVTALDDVNAEIKAAKAVEDPVITELKALRAEVTALREKR
jgi:voltage-gated sodium channel